MGIEKQTTEPVSQETKEALDTRAALRTEVSALQRLIGPPRPVLEQPSQYDLGVALQDVRGDAVVYTDARVFFLRNELTMRKRALQLEAHMNKFPDRETIDRKAELIVANQAVTYNQYFPAVLDHFVAFMERYDEEMEVMIPNLPPERRSELDAERRQAVLYLQKVKELVQDRIRYASVLALDEEMQGIADMPAQKQRFEDLKTARNKIVSTLSQSSKDAIQREEALRAQYLEERDRQKKEVILENLFQVRRDHSVSSEGMLIDVLKGNPEGKNIPGAPKNYFPQRLYLRTLQNRYSQLRELQIDIAGRMEWSETQRKSAQDYLSNIRRDTLSEIIDVTKLLAAHHSAMEEMTMIQNQFGTQYHYEGAFNPLGTTTPDASRETIAKSIDGAQSFHLDRLTAMLDQVDTSFNPNGLESLTDAGVMEMVNNMNRFSGMLRGLITWGLPEGPQKQSIDTWLDQTLPLAIRDSLESERGPDGKPLSKEKKLEKIRDVIIAFRNKGSILKYRETLGVLKTLPKASTFAAQEVQPDVITIVGTERFIASPEGRIVNVNGQEVAVNGATAMVLLLRQMKADGEAFAADYEQFLGNMEDLVDIRLGLKTEVNMIAQGWLRVAEMLGIGATAAAVIPWVAAGAGGTAALYMLRKTPAILRGAIHAPATAAKYLAPSRLLLTGATAVQAYRTYKDFEQIGEISDVLEQQRTAMTIELKAAGFESDPVGQEDRFTYKDGGTQVTVNVRELREAQNAREVGQMIRTGADVAELAIWLQAMRVGAISGPQAIALVGIEVTVETIMYGMDQTADRKFLSRCPAWLLAKINVEQTIGDKKYGMLATASEWMLTDPLTDNSDEQKKDIREKMIFIMLTEEMKGLPELASELFPAGLHPKDLDTFFKGEFTTVFLKYYYVRLNQIAGGSVAWDDLKEGRIGGTNLLPARTPELSSVNIRTALRESLVVYLEHRKERDYLDAQVSLERYRALPDRNPGAQSVLADVVHSMGERTSFGTRVEQLQADQIVDGDGRTRVQRMIDSLYEQAGKGGSMAIQAQSIPSLGSDWDFMSGQEMLDRLVTEPAIRMKLRQVYPRDTEEKQNAEGREWHDAMTYVDAIDIQAPSELNPMGAYAAIDFHLSFAGGAADNIRSSLQKEPIVKPPTLGSVFFGAEADQTTLENALSHISSDGIELVESDENVAAMRSHLQRDERLASDLYGNDNPPLVFSQGDPPEEICRKLSELRLPKEYAGLSLSAVFFERRSISIGHEMVLATYVLGDIEGRKIQILQRVAATSQLARTNKQSVPGFIIPVSVRDMERKTGLGGMLQLAERGLKERQRDAVNSAAQDRAREQEKTDEWKREKQSREVRIAEREQQRARAIEISLRSLVPVYIPPKLIADESLRMLREEGMGGDEYRMNIDGSQITLFMKRTEGASMSAVTKTNGVRKPTSLEKCSFTAIVDGKQLNYSIALDALGELSETDRVLARAVLTTPLSLAGHPRANDPQYVESVRRFELSRIIDAATYSETIRWYPEDYRSNLILELWPIYRDAKDKEIFLRTLYNNLTLEPVIKGSVYNRIVKNMKSFSVE